MISRTHRKGNVQMSRKIKSILSIALSFMMLLAMGFSIAGVAGLSGSPSIVVLGSDGAGSDAECDPYDISCATLTVAGGVYTGNAIKPAVTVKIDGKKLSNDAYTVSYSNNTNAGTAKATVKGVDPYFGSKSKAFTISKAANPVTVKAKTVTAKYSIVKKKALKIAAKKAFAVSKAQGKVTYKKASGNSKIAVSSAGKVTIKKGLKKNTYKVKVKVKAAGNSNYKAATKTVVLKVKVK